MLRLELIEEQSKKIEKEKDSKCRNLQQHRGPIESKLDELHMAAIAEGIYGEKKREKLANGMIYRREIGTIFGL